MAPRGKSNAPRRRWPPAPPELSPAEAMVLPWLGEELTYREIGRQLGIKEATVRIHASRIYLKLGALTRHGALVAWLRPDLIHGTVN